jgi:DNA-binding NtrC family response regulator
MTQAQGHILIVDDEPAVVYTLRCILEKVGYTISEAATGLQARELLASLPIDVIICDLGLVDESGIKVLEEAREVRPEAGQIMLTGYAPPETVEALEAQGISVFMKPVEMARLVSELRLIIERKAA